MKKCHVVRSRPETLDTLYRLITTRAERDKTRQFFTEGMRFVSRALESRWTHILSAVYAPGLATHPFARQLCR